MRSLSLHEKISIKGKLASRGVNSSVLARLTMPTAVDLFWRCFGKPAAMHSTPTNWRKSLRSISRLPIPTQQREVCHVA